MPHVSHSKIVHYSLSVKNKSNFDDANESTIQSFSSNSNMDGGFSNDEIKTFGNDHLRNLFLVLAVMAVLPITASAVDHPMDYIYLKIPNPIPDADPRYFFSGGLCAAASHGFTTPIDVVKTKMQSEPNVYNQGFANAAQKIIQDDGAAVLLGGLGPTIVGYGTEGAMKFGLYESLKPTVANLLHIDDVTVPYLIASVVAGAVASLLLCPMERTRIRLVTDPTFANGLITGVSKLIQENGFVSIFSGMPAMLSKQVPYTMTKQVTFDVFAGMLYAMAAKASLAQSDVKFEVAVLAALLASILSCLASHPGDVVLTDTFKNQSNDNAGFIGIVSNIYQKQGIAGFFTGITARFVHVGAIITSQLVLYDIVKQMLGLPATGTH